MVDDAEKKLLADAGHRIRETRAAQGLSLEQLARLTGISGPALSLIETGKRDPRLTTLKVTEPPKRSAGIKVKTVDELIENLKTAGAIA